MEALQIIRIKRNIIMKVTLTRVFTEEKVSPKTNKAYTSMSIKTEEHGDTWLSGFMGDENRAWKDGDIVEVDITEREYNGKTYYNFSVPGASKGKGGSGAMKALADRVSKLEEDVKNLMNI